MDKNLGAELEVNNVPVELSPFVDAFLTRTVVGAASSLKGAKNIHKLELYLEQGIITNTIIGLVSPLKGVDKVDSLKINITVE
jgi:hypothetical protein